MSLNFNKRTYIDGETVITAENLNDIQDAILDLDSGLSGKYEKPSGGIPSSDLAQAVQTSLGKADTALQDADVDSVPTENSDNPVASGGVYTALAGKVNSSAVGAASGVASLDSSGKVPSSQLPPSTDSLPLTGGTMSGEINMGSNKITGLANGTNASDAVSKSQLDAAILGALLPSGSVAFASLPSLTAANLNHVYNVTDAFTTTSDFLEGAGKNYPAGTNVAIINTGTAENPVYKYDVYGSFVDLSAYRTSADQDVIDAGKLGTSGDGSNVTAAFTAASTRMNIATGEKLSVIFGKIAKWFADLGTAAFRAATSSISSGSTDLVESGAVYTALDGKADKVQSATNGNFAALDANGNLTDSGHKNSDYAPSNAGIPSGGSTGQYLKKKSNTDYDTEWATGGSAGTGDVLPLSGGSLSGNINMDGNRVQNLPTPSANGDAASKGYTDGIVSVSDTQPTSAQNKLWIKEESGNGVEVPTVAEMQAADALSAKADMLGIVINGNSTPVGAAVGQYVIVKNSTISGITDGLYTAAQTIPANTAIDATYLTAVSGGGLNAINTTEAYTVTDIGTRPYTTKCELRRCGKIVSLIIGGIWFNNPVADVAQELAQIPSELVAGLGHNIIVTSLMTDGGGAARGYARWWVNSQDSKIYVKSNTTVNMACGVSGVATWILP